MRTIINWLDAAKAITGSDNKTAQQLGLSRQMVSRIRAGVSMPSNRTCRRLAQLVDVEPIQIIASVECQRDPSEAEQWAQEPDVISVRKGLKPQRSLSDT